MHTRPSTVPMTQVPWYAVARTQQALGGEIQFRRCGTGGRERERARERKRERERARERERQHVLNEIGRRPHSWIHNAVVIGARHRSSMQRGSRDESWDGIAVDGDQRLSMRIASLLVVSRKEVPRLLSALSFPLRLQPSWGPFPSSILFSSSPLFPSSVRQGQASMHWRLRSSMTQRHFVLSHDRVVSRAGTPPPFGRDSGRWWAQRTGPQPAEQHRNLRGLAGFRVVSRLACSLAKTIP
ncbi:hypothetical protein F4808DRAFT_115891 [Astrocystis sublimbata]|nr:hypothetical protein F4808DRAFT_115891 [Astrocystis sublimbata]